MNKKVLILFILSISIFLTSCSKRERFNYDYPEQIKIQKNVIFDYCYKKDVNLPQQYETLIINDEQQIKDIIDNLNSIVYVKSKTIYEFCLSKYIVEFDDEKIFVFRSDYFNRNEVKKGSFNFLDNVNIAEKNE